MADDDQPDLSAFETDDSDGDTGDASDDIGTAADTEGPDGRGAKTPDASDDADAENDSDASDPRPVSELDRSERVELGVDLLAHIEWESLSLSEAVDRIESVTTNPALTREILDTAELRGVIEREEGRLRTRRGGTFVRFEQEVIEREGDYECRRCGAGLSTGHFVRFEAGELGPFGPSCVRKILGRE